MPAEDIVDGKKRTVVGYREETQPEDPPDERVPPGCFSLDHVDLTMGVLRC